MVENMTDGFGSNITKQRELHVETGKVLEPSQCAVNFHFIVPLFLYLHQNHQSSLSSFSFICLLFTNSKKKDQ
jgi:hypothetical protein